MATVTLDLARFLVGCMAVFGFLFSQVLFHSFSVPHTLAGVGGLAAAVIGGRPFARRSTRRRPAALVCVALAFLGVLLSAYVYYSKYNVPGNDFGWLVKAPYLVVLAYIAMSATKLMDRFYGEPSAV
jgi:hypothetical protein